MTQTICIAVMAVAYIGYLAWDSWLDHKYGEKTTKDSGTVEKTKK